MIKIATGLCATILLAAASAASAQEATISGTVKFDGKYKPKKLNSKISGDKYCGPQNAGVDVYDEEVILGANGELANVFVWIKKGAPAGPHKPPGEVVEIDQTKCVYRPHIIALMVGQKLRIKNSDDTMHNIHSLPKLNKEFNEGQGVKGMTTEKEFTVQEIGVKIKCDVHMWMGAWMHVVEHPFFAVSGIDGFYKIGKLPPGEYELEFWHEKYGKKSVPPIKVGDKEAKTQDFTFKPE